MKRVLHAITKSARALSPSRIKKSLSKKRMIHRFCEDVGLVYFGFVNQREDDHHIVRGLTVSNAHRDHHYCIGTYEGYDVVFVERSDIILTSHRHIWHILEIDLKTASDLPHIFIGSPTHGMGFHSLLSAKYPSLHPAHLGVLGIPSPDFSDNFKLYAKPDQWLAAERIFSPDITEKIGKHFQGLVLEISGDSLFIYSERSHLTTKLLETMLQNGIWLASVIDEKSQST